MSDALPTTPSPATPAPWRPVGLGGWLMLVIAAACLTPWTLLVPAIARWQVEAGLLIGIALALAGVIAAGPRARALSRWLIQVCVVLLGFRMDLGEVARAGISGLAFAAGTIIGTFALGAALARLLRVERTTAALVSTGTAICGGSAIAAVSGVIGAAAPQIAVATGTVFLLNAVGLLAFPPLGQALGLTPTQFGTWAGVAIHDVSSVVGAAQSFAASTKARGVEGAMLAVDTATVVKLTRVLWIIPICLIAGWIVSRARRSGSASSLDKAPTPPAGRRSPVPWFIALFLLAAGVRTLFPSAIEPLAGAVPVLAKSGMTLALFLIGAGLSRSALAKVGWRAMALGVALWIAISVAALIVVRATVA